jgi:L-cysteine desulfidase
MKYENEYIKILEHELIPVNGCTEPVSIAFAACLAKKYLEENPTSIEVVASRSIIKNVKAVVVPNTNGLRGVKAAVAIGIVGGDSDKHLLCISEVSKDKIQECKDLINNVPININMSESKLIFDIYIKLIGKENVVEVRIADNHDNVVLIKKNEQILFEKEIIGIEKVDLSDKSILTVENILEFVNTVDIEKVRPIIQKQIDCNMEIAKEGLKNSYGANIGKTLLSLNDNSLITKAKAYAAAGSDARMSGCNMPVVINSGSGNQGMTCTIPVVIYADELKVSPETKIRAVLLSNLLTLHVKEGIGLLSAYCGAIAAGCCAGAAIAYLYGHGIEGISETLVNSIAISSGIICDGAKSSCAAKIALAVESGIFGYHMFVNGNNFKNGEGIVNKGVETTIKNVGKLASRGMVETDKQIVNIMLEK